MGEKCATYSKVYLVCILQFSQDKIMKNKSGTIENTCSRKIKMGLLRTLAYEKHVPHLCDIINLSDIMV